MLDIGHQQFLVLLFVIQAEQDQFPDFQAIPMAIQVRNQFIHVSIDMRSIAVHLSNGRPRQQAPLRPWKRFADSLVIGIEEVIELRIKRLVAL